MGALGKDICDRCYTTHPLNDDGERPCPKPPIEINTNFVPAVIWKTAGSTRGYDGGGNIPKTPGINPGHRVPTLGDLGLSAEQGKQLGI